MPHLLSARPLDSWCDPFEVFRLLESSSDDVFWLDAGSDARDGWSFVGVGTAASSLPREVALGTPPVGESTDDDAYPPFRGGWIGWRDYESGAAAAGSPVAGPHGESDPTWLRATRVAAFDHARRRVWALAAAADLDAWQETLDATPVGASALPTSGTQPNGVVIAQARHDPAEYERLIERCRDLIRAGIAYQLCLTTRFTVEGHHDAVAVYRRLRGATPAHHGGFIRIAGRALLSASPEQFLRVSGGAITTRPIKGTRPRGSDGVQDAALAAELRASRKERAENVMIVDLMRNDLSRVCEPGSIRVDGLWTVESYPAVHQLVSTVRGTASTGTTVGDLFDATFPAGSMTGAPKLSAMSRLHALEGGPRGIYAGCFGYIGIDGEIDLAMVIRSIVIEGATAFVGAGGGITWGSEAADEVAEVATKARAPLAALGAVLPVPWGSDILN